MGDLLSNPNGDVRFGHEANHVFSAAVNRVLDMNTANITGVNVLNPAWTAHNSNEIARLENNAKRPSRCHGLDEAVPKCARHEDHARRTDHFLESPSLCVALEQKPSHVHGEEDLCFTFSECGYWKHVPIGPGHQADVPQFRPYRQSGYGATSPLKNKNSLPVELEFNEHSASKWLGTCVVPMPDLESISVEAQGCKTTFVCCCEDAGSVRCVRSHILEARENLERTLGHEMFVNLSFGDLGETVAERWTKEEEDFFRRIVLLNPASLGRNFWTLLSLSFPTRSAKEIVSYYFNVFILRNRAEQNRSDLLNADSDDDEGQESGEEDDENSVLFDSPIDRDDTGHDRDLYEQDEIDSEVYEQLDVGCEDDGLHGGSDECGVYESKSDKNSSYGTDDRDVHVDSCTSSEGQFNEVGFTLHKAKHGNENLQCRNDCASAVTDYDCIDGHYIRASEKAGEFLPTCYVIEEMLGKESWVDGGGRPPST